MIAPLLFAAMNLEWELFLFFSGDRDPLWYLCRCLPPVTHLTQYLKKKKASFRIRCGEMIHRWVRINSPTLRKNYLMNLMNSKWLMAGIIGLSSHFFANVPNKLQKWKLEIKPHSIFHGPGPCCIVFCFFFLNSFSLFHLLPIWPAQIRGLLFTSLFHFWRKDTRGIKYTFVGKQGAGV